MSAPRRFATAFLIYTKQWDVLEVASTDNATVFGAIIQTMHSPAYHLPIMPSVLSLQVGRIGPLGLSRVRSAFIKLPVAGPLRAQTLGLEGDQQADLRVHGGPDKAVYFYPSEHYPRWIADAPRHAAIMRPGAFGENVTTVGLSEQTVAIGDCLAIGTSQMQVTQPRQPCSKLAMRFADNELGKMMDDTGRTGWYVRVIQPGELKAGDEIRVIRRPNPQWTIERFNQFVVKAAPLEELREFAGIEGLPEDYRQKVQRVLQHLSGG